MFGVILPNSTRVVEAWTRVDIASVFCSARAIGWLTAAAQRTNQSAAAVELSAIRSCAQESFNREQREGAEQPFS